MQQPGQIETRASFLGSSVTPVAERPALLPSDVRAKDYTMQLACLLGAGDEFLSLIGAPPQHMDGFCLRKMNLFGLWWAAAWIGPYQG